MDQIAWTPKQDNSNSLQRSDLVRVKVFYREAEVRAKVWSAGGRLFKERKLWELPLAEVRALGLEHRIVRGTDGKER